MAKSDKRKKELFASWMTLEQLQKKHAQLDQLLTQASQTMPPDQPRITELKKLKLLCKDLIQLKQRAAVIPKENRPSADIIPIKRTVPQTSLFLGMPRIVSARR